MVYDVVVQESGIQCKLLADPHLLWRQQKTLAKWTDGGVHENFTLNNSFGGDHLDTLVLNVCTLSPVTLLITFRYIAKSWWSITKQQLRRTVGVKKKKEWEYSLGSSITKDDLFNIL